MTVRRPIHAGSWYDQDGEVLQAKIRQWLEEPEAIDGKHASAIIGPHAGYRYCGHVLAHAFKQVQPDKVKRIFMLGPSHHFFSRRCLLSPASIYASPLGDFRVDSEVYEHLHATGMFDVMTMKQDEEEHSLEMHLPCVAYMFNPSQVTIVPIVVGSISATSEAKLGELLAPYLNDSGNLFALSSDFCHWGARFGYTPYDQNEGSVHQYIEYLDRTGMEAIETGDVLTFQRYLQETNNTICGRHAIAIYMHAMRYSKPELHIKFRKYDQSSRATSMRDSSVSYAAAVITAAAA